MTINQEYQDDYTTILEIDGEIKTFDAATIGTLKKDHINYKSYIIFGDARLKFSSSAERDEFFNNLKVWYIQYISKQNKKKGRLLC